jgi:hypothetical protein
MLVGKGVDRARVPPCNCDQRTRLPGRSSLRICDFRIIDDPSGQLEHRVSGCVGRHALGIADR